MMRLGSQSNSSLCLCISLYIMLMHSVCGMEG